jgi:citrate lyase subunit beta/citryl-CoA lyase
VRPYRSLLFVPGHRDGWAVKAAGSGADALILDLEDAVPPDRKDGARGLVAAALDELSTARPGLGLLVRPNAWSTGRAGADLAAVVRPGLTGLLLPKVAGRDDLLRLDGLLGYLEERAGLVPGTVELIVSLETAAAMAAVEALCAAPRVAGALCAAARDGDFAREIGYQWSPAGPETLHLRGRTVLACAAARRHPLVGLWQELRDLDGLAEFARANRALGFRGQVVIHPSHVGPVNVAYTAPAAELDRYRAMVATFQAAQERGNAAVDFDGEHIDIAHVTTAREALAFADALEKRSLA